MDAHRFGRKLKLPSTIAIKHQIGKLMAEDEAKGAEAGARPESTDISQTNVSPKRQGSHPESPGR
jgi:hypothetical protein